jgi:hypothetical protein
MGPRQLRLAVLTGLVAILVAIVVVQTRGPRPASDGGASSSPATPRGQTAAGADIQQAEVVELEALEAPRPEPVGGERNPFRFGSREASPGASDDPERPRPSSPSAPPPVPLMPAPPPGPPPIALKFIGVVEAPAQGGTLAVLSDGRSVFHGREGEVVDGRYRIVRIGVESVEMTYVDGQGRQTIRLTGQ